MKTFGTLTALLTDFGTNRHVTEYARRTGTVLFLTRTTTFCPKFTNRTLVAICGGYTFATFVEFKTDSKGYLTCQRTRKITLFPSFFLGVN